MKTSLRRCHVGWDLKDENELAARNWEKRTSFGGGTLSAKTPGMFVRQKGGCSHWSIMKDESDDMR